VTKIVANETKEQRDLKMEADRILAEAKANKRRRRRRGKRSNG
jgi:hypothetical protein